MQCQNLNKYSHVIVLNFLDLTEQKTKGMFKLMQLITRSNILPF